MLKDNAQASAEKRQESSCDLITNKIRQKDIYITNKKSDILCHCCGNQTDTTEREDKPDSRLAWTEELS